MASIKPSFESFPIGAKVQCYDKDGYFVMDSCGYIASQIADGHAIIKTFNGVFFSTVGQRIVEIEVLS